MPASAALGELQLPECHEPCRMCDCKTGVLYLLLTSQDDMAMLPWGSSALTADRWCMWSQCMHACTFTSCLTELHYPAAAIRVDLYGMDLRSGQQQLTQCQAHTADKCICAHTSRRARQRLCLGCSLYPETAAAAPTTIRCKCAAACSTQPSMPSSSVLSTLCCLQGGELWAGGGSCLSGTRTCRNPAGSWVHGCGGQWGLGCQRLQLCGSLQEGRQRRGLRGHCGRLSPAVTLCESAGIWHALQCGLDCSCGFRAHLRMQRSGGPV